MTEQRRPRSTAEEPSISSWFSPWGATALLCVALAIALASLVGTRWLTIAFALLGGLIAAVLAWVERAKWRIQDWIWLAASGALSALVLSLVGFAPGILNSRWAIDRAIPVRDPNQLAVVPHDKAMQKGRPLSQDETVDFALEAIRQDDVVLLVDSVKVGEIAGKGRTPYLLVQFRVVNLEQGQSISLQGFGEHPPVLSDSTGRSFTFVEQRLKQIKDRTQIFVDWDRRQAVEIPPRGAQDMLLVFELPPPNVDLHLNISSAAWGRVGTCRFRIAGLDPAKL